MNRRITLCAVLVGAMLVALGSVAAGRTWIDATGQFNIDGEFVAIDGSAVRIKTAEGKVISIPLEKLSKDDQKFVENLKKAAAAANPFAEAPKDDSKTKAKPGEPSESSETDGAAFVKALSSKIESKINGIDAKDTTERRHAALQEANHELTDEFAKPVIVTFQFPVKDVVKSSGSKKGAKRASDNDDKGGSGHYILRLGRPEGVPESQRSGFLFSVTLDMTADEASQIHVGDVVELSGKAKLVIGDPITLSPYARLDNSGDVKSGQPKTGVATYIPTATDRPIKGIQPIVHVVLVNDHYWLCLNPCKYTLIQHGTKTTAVLQPAPAQPQNPSPSSVAATSPSTPQKIVELSDRQEDAVVLGNLRKGTKLTIQYVSGKWKDWGRSATESPDTDSPQRGDECRVAIANHPSAGPNTVLALVPAGTAVRAYEWVCPDDLERVTLRINSKLGDYAKHPGGVVRYKLTIVEPEPARTEIGK